MNQLRQALFAALLVCCLSAFSQAQVFKQVPSNALVVVKFSKLDALSKKVAALATDLGVAQMNPDFTDPLTAIETKGGIIAGVNNAGDAALIFVNPGDPASPEINVSSNSMIALIPVSDYKAFLGNMTDTTTEGDVTSGHFKNDADMAYVANWGEYAAVTEMKELLAKKPEGLTPAGATAKQMDGKDFVVYVNFANLGPKLAPKIEEGRTELQAGLDKFVNKTNTDPKVAAELKPYLSVIKVALNQVLNVAVGVVNETDAVLLTANLGAKGITISEVADFKADSYAGKIVSQLTNTPNSLLTGLPDGKYILYGGGTSDPKLATMLMNDFLDPISAELAKVDGTFVKPIQKLIGCIKTAGAADQGETFGLLVPAGQLGNDPLLQMIGIRTGDAKALVGAAKDAIDAQQELMQAVGGPAATASKTTYTANAKTVDGVSFDSIHTDYNLDPTTPQAAQMAQFLQYLYGPNGMDALTGVVNDKTYLGFVGVNEQVISSTLATIKANDDPLARTDAVKAVAAQLPTQRVSVIYFALDQVANVALNTAKQMGIDMGIKLPDNLPPIGVTISTAGTAISIDGYIPTDLVKALTSAGMQMAMHRNGGQGPRGPGM